MPGRRCNPISGVPVKRALTAIILAIFLGGCPTPQTPEPEIKVDIAKVAVTLPCKPTLPARPKLMTKEQIKGALVVAPTLDDKVKIVTEQLLSYIGWTPVVEGALEGCGKVPSGTSGN